jgi:hypothetical protein
MDEVVAAAFFLLQYPLRVKIKHYADQTRFIAATIELHPGTG